MLDVASVGSPGFWSTGVRLLAVALLLIAPGCGSDAPRNCATHVAGCPCDATGGCANGYDCVSQQCVEPMEIALRINAQDARACELVVVDGESRVTGVTFEDSAQGTHIRRGRRTAITFISREDRALGAAAILRTYGEGERHDVTVEQSRCFDRQGEEIAGSSVTVGRRG